MRSTSEDFRKRNSRMMNRVKNIVRRFTIVATDGVSWALEGFRKDSEVEDDNAEVWHAIGLHTRPPGTTRAECIIVRPGANSNNAAIIATRDHDTLKAVLDAMGLTDLSQDESMLYNSSAHVRVKADGTVEVRSHDGTAVSLAKKSELNALADHVDDHKHGGVTTGGGTSAIPTSTAPQATGTTKLKGE